MAQTRSVRSADHGSAPTKEWDKVKRSKNEKGSLLGTFGRWQGRLRVLQPRAGMSIADLSNAYPPAAQSPKYNGPPGIRWQVTGAFKPDRVTASELAHKPSTGISPVYHFT